MRSEDESKVLLVTGSAGGVGSAVVDRFSGTGWRAVRVDVVEQADWDRVMGVNLKGLYFPTSAAVPYIKRTEGCVVNLSSDAGLQGNAGAAVYCAAKGAVSVLTKAVALELAPFGVRVNAVCPGDIDTPTLAGQAREHSEDDPAASLERLRSGYPQGAGRSRFVEPGEVAEMIWNLCQPHAAPTTGANISIDFGLSVGIV